METDERRIVRLGGTRNLRDVGGYVTREGRRTRWRTLYRSDCLDRLDEVGQAWLISAGVRTIVDLRDDREIVERPNVFAESAHMKYGRMPFWEQPPPATLEPNVRQGYRSELDQVGDVLARLVLAVLETEALPALIHCAGGKDRTGIGIAILLEAVGVEREAIAEDYALSEVCLGPEYIEETREWVVRNGFDWEIWAHVAEAPPERMIKTLEYLDERHGGVRRFLVDHWFPSQRFDELCELLTESRG